MFSPEKMALLSGMSFAFFNTAGYATAEVTGAFGFREYGEIAKYADAYDLQAIYARMQDNAEKDVFAAAMLAGSIVAKPTPTEIEDVKRQLRLALGGMLIMENIANRLNELYAKALKDGA